jgi:hypothetical protein
LIDSKLSAIIASEKHKTKKVPHLAIIDEDAADINLDKHHPLCKIYLQ